MADVHPEVAESYTAVTDKENSTIGWQRPIYMRPPIGSPDGGAYTTVHDMNKLMQALQHEILLSPQLSKAFFTPKVDYAQRETYDLKYGFSNLFVFSKEGETMFILNQGEDKGVSSKAVYFPDSEVTAVL